VGLRDPTLRRLASPADNQTAKPHEPGWQDALDADGLRERARAVGLDLSAFDAARRSEAAKERIERDVRSGERAAVAGTTALFVAGEPYGGSYDADSLAEALERSSASGAGSR
jgi:protein-disulfide isomerase